MFNSAVCSISMHGISHLCVLDKRPTCLGVSFYFPEIPLDIPLLLTRHILRAWSPTLHVECSVARTVYQQLTMNTVPPEIVQFNVIIILILIFGYVVSKRLLFGVSKKINKFAYYTENYSDIMRHLVLPQGLCTTRTRKKTKTATFVQNAQATRTTFPKKRKRKRYAYSEKFHDSRKGRVIVLDYNDRRLIVYGKKGFFPLVSHYACFGVLMVLSRR